MKTSLKFKIRKNETSIFFLYVLFSILFPALFINKALFLLLFFILGARLILGYAIPARVVFALIYLFLILSLGAIHSIFFSKAYDPILLSQMFFSCSPLLLIFLFGHLNYDMDKLLIDVAIIFSIVTILLYQCINMSIFLDNSSMMLFLKKYSLFAIGYRNFNSINLYMFCFGSVHFIFIPFVLLFRRTVYEGGLMNVLKLACLIMTIILSTSRALISASCLVAMFIYINNFKIKFIRISCYFIAALLLVVLLWSIDLHTNAISFKDPGNYTKLKHLWAFLSVMKPLDWIIGQGLGSCYYSIFLNKQVCQTEIVFLDIVRYLGLIQAIFVFFLLLCPSLSPQRTLSRENRFYFILFVIYLLLAQTNPILFNSYGILVVLWYWSHCLFPNTKLNSSRVISNNCFLKGYPV